MTALTGRRQDLDSSIVTHERADFDAIVVVAALLFPEARPCCPASLIATCRSFLPSTATTFASSMPMIVLRRARGAPVDYRRCAVGECAAW